MLAEMVNPTVGRTPWRLFEIADQIWFPAFLRRRCQSMLAAQWTRRIPMLQSKSPAQLAAELVAQALDEVAGPDNLTVVDFCSGGGGPTPVIERIVNETRLRQDREAIHFLLSDLHPPLDDWTALARHSEHLSFVPQPVDATRPPPSVTSSTALDAPDAADRKIFRLYSLAFHHFDDALASQVLRSTLETSDGFAILELQDRKLASLLLMLLLCPLVLLTTPLWFWPDPLRLLFTYPLPLLPAVHAFDGLVSCLRTRTFTDLLELICPRPRHSHAATDHAATADWRTASRRQAGAELVHPRGTHWALRSGRLRHTWPAGYINYIVGIRTAR